MQAHEDLVEDVAWHLKDENIFGSVGDDCKLMVWDLRTNKPEQSIAAHEKEVGML
jgi:histone-binding protein RBBP4